MPVYQNVTLSHTETVFLLHCLNSFKEDIQKLSSSIILHTDPRNAKINADWLQWLEKQEKDLRLKICGELDVNDTNLLNIFHREKK